MKRKALLSILMSACLFPLAARQTLDTGDNKTYWLPQQVTEVKRPVLSLNGEWDFKYDARSRWTDIQVPGEAAMQGYAIRHDSPFCYRRTFAVPKDFAGKRIILRFDGVYSRARLSINGNSCANTGAASPAGKPT